MRQVMVIVHSRLVSWNTAIGKGGEAILAEINMKNSGINLHKFSNEPLFGDLADECCKKIFKRSM